MFEKAVRTSLVQTYIHNQCISIKEQDRSWITCDSSLRTLGIMPTLSDINWWIGLKTWNNILIWSLTHHYDARYVVELSRHAHGLRSVSRRSALVSIYWYLTRRSPEWKSGDFNSNNDDNNRETWLELIFKRTYYRESKSEHICSVDAVCPSLSRANAHEG